MSNHNANHLKCRGKAANGWVVGYFLPQNPEVAGSGAAIYVFPEEGQYNSVCFAVDPETVTPCSGLLDKQDRLIFDQDILINRKTKVGGVVEYSDYDGMFGLVLKNGDFIHFSDVLSSDFEIVGNTFDQPDYLNYV